MSDSFWIISVTVAIVAFALLARPIAGAIWWVFL